MVQNDVGEPCVQSGVAPQPQRAGAWEGDPEAPSSSAVYPAVVVLLTRQ